MKNASRILLGLATGALLSGCVGGPYVAPEATNPVWPGAYTRAETIPAGQRLANAMLGDPLFAQYYTAKAQQRGGLPVLQVAHIANATADHTHGLTALREDIEETLRGSGRFVLSGDPDACDYILKGKYSAVQDGMRTTHRVTMRLHDVSADIDVWTGSEEIAKQ